MRANKIKQNEVQMLNHKHEVMQRKIEFNQYKQQLRKMDVDQQINANEQRVQQMALLEQ